MIRMRAFIIKLILGLILVGGATYAAYYYTQESHGDFNEETAKKVRTVVDKRGYVDNTVSVEELRKDVDKVSEDVLRGELESRLPDIEDRQKADRMTRRLIQKGVVTDIASQERIQAAINAMDVFPDSEWKEKRLMSLADASQQLSDSYTLRRNMDVWLTGENKNKEIPSETFEKYRLGIRKLKNEKTYNELTEKLGQLQDRIKK